jgi:predicted nucleic acid-binding Zn ribbon protein
MKRDIARELYRSYKSGYKKKREIVEEERSLKSEPEKISKLISELVENREWRQGIAEGNLFSDWAQIVGSDVAEHARPITLFEGKLTIQTTSTAWSTQLRLIESELLKTIRKSSPGALVDELLIIGPHAPSWKRGLRTIRGAKGARDTFG